MPTTAKHPSPVRCLLVDEHPAVLDAVSRVLEEAGVRIVGVAMSGAKALALLERRTADVALVDARLPDLGGIQLAEAIAKLSSPPRTLLYSGFPDAQLAGQALEAGISGLITKGSPLSEVTRAVYAVAAGGTYFDPLLAAQLAQHQHGWSKLSARDEQLLEQMSLGLTDDRIGEQLHLSPETIRANVRRLVQTMGARNRTHAVALALRTRRID